MTVCVDAVGFMGSLRSLWALRVERHEFDCVGYGELSRQLLRCSAPVCLGSSTSESICHLGTGWSQNLTKPQTDVLTLCLRAF